ncbi:UDP-glucuronosyltransferase 1-3 [Orchesella cincta]|uniref:UDP-glucuronosyltransferase n=1 Tax=Orchesella cincta TaxID=48709 RepID=A0A1D2MS01_ORCCI|nr:UDP-glucuronosyltransferase 1-3 [Orchesella cincta]
MEFKGVIVLFLVQIFLIPNGHSENILFFHPVSTYSHRISVWPLVQRLVAKGHQITFISPYPNKTPLANVTDLVPEPMSSFVHQYIHDWFMSDCALGLAYKFKAKTMYYAASCLTPLYYELYGIVPDTASIPEFEYHYRSPMSFYERFVTTIQPLVWTYKMSTSHDAITEIIREKLNVPEMPNIRKLAENTSLILLAEYVIDGYPQPLTPNIISVGGMHCQAKINPLPKNLAEFIKGSPEGFVYISLGSGVNVNNLPEKFQDVFFNSIKQMPHIQFIWKWTGNKRTDLPKNLHIGEWFPQQDILGHPKLLAFMTQGGRPSIQESICHGAPVIGLPVFADQDLNTQRLENLGGAIVLQFDSLTETTFQNAITEMTSSKKYKTRMTQLSKLYHDRPVKPIDLALYWTEYVLRNENTDHLRSMSRNLTWYQRRLLDVWGTIIVAVIASITVIAYTIQRVRCFFKGNGKFKKE